MHWSAYLGVALVLVLGVWLFYVRAIRNPVPGSVRNLMVKGFPASEGSADLVPTLVWDAPANARSDPSVRYECIFDSIENGKFHNTVVVDDPFISFPLNQDISKYSVTVTPFNGAGTGPAMMLKVDLRVPSEVPNITFVDHMKFNDTTGSFVFTWDPAYPGLGISASDVAYIYELTDPNGVVSPAKQTTSTELELTAPVYEGIYKLELYAKNSNGDGPKTSATGRLTRSPDSQTLYAAPANN